MKHLYFDSKLHSFHNFSKSNLVTNRDGSDTYVCVDCGLKGKRYGLNDFITLSRPSKVKLTKCNGSKGVFKIEELKKEKDNLLGSKIVVINDSDLFNFGIYSGDILNVVECPPTESKELDGV